MRPSRRTQPYRRSGDRVPSHVLDMMLKGTGPLGNPADLKRREQRVNAIVARLLRGR